MGVSASSVFATVCTEGPLLGLTLRKFVIHIDYAWSINTPPRWDIIARFGPRYPNLPPAFFSDFTKMALDESKHLWVCRFLSKQVLSEILFVVPY